MSGGNEVFSSGIGLEPDDFDFHRAITIRERSSRYIRTALDYYVQLRGRQELDRFLSAIHLDRESSIYKHITDDGNWNSYALEVYIYERLLDRVENKYQAVWDFGIASGSGFFDQKDDLLNFKLRIAPLGMILKHLSDTTEKVSLVSKTYGRQTGVVRVHGRKKAIQGELHFDYVRLPAEFARPHWSSIVAGFGIVYGTIRFRKGLKCELKIVRWPVLPSDLPEFQGMHYRLEKDGAVRCVETGDVVGRNDGSPFEINGVVFNNGTDAVAHLEWEPEAWRTKFLNTIFYRRRLKREEDLRQYREAIVNDLNLEHQHQLARYEGELSSKAKIIEERMEEIQNLKIHQDADYFLTSLLMAPFIANRNESPRVKTATFVRQKKRFKFRKWRAELGGDLCLTDNVVLLGRRYTVVINGDAMGKSMQGAGGALVLGTVFNAYVTRTHFSFHLQEKPPELWLRDAYMELQNVFIAFDGSMMVSAVAALVDEQNGMVYYINADHPSCVLYRSGKAIFVEDRKHFLRKIGVPGEEENIRIHMFQMLPGDIFIMGSDGRDDLELRSLTPVGDEGSRVRDVSFVRNEDETCFLRRVEESGGNLRLLYDRLRRSGRFTDDLSLLSVAYNPPVPDGESPFTAADQELLLGSGLAIRSGDFARGAEMLEELVASHPERHDLVRQLALLLYRQEDFVKAAEWMEAFLDRFPGDNEVLFLHSLARKRCGQWKRALLCARRLYLRNPDHEKNLVNLADLYRILGQRQSSVYFAEKALSINDTNRLALKVLDLLAKSSSTEHQGGFAERDEGVAPVFRIDLEGF